jgi:energy-coupling factor transporter ATP-binding protein EcfA2
VIDLIHRLNARGMTFLVIEHNLKVVRAFSRRVIVLDHGADLQGSAARRAERPGGGQGLSRQKQGTHEALLEVRGSARDRGDVPVLSDVSLAVGADEISFRSSARTAPARPRS